MQHLLFGCAASASIDMAAIQPSCLFVSFFHNGLHLLILAGLLTILCDRHPSVAPSPLPVSFPTLPFVAPGNPSRFAVEGAKEDKRRVSTPPESGGSSFR